MAKSVCMKFLFRSGQTFLMLTSNTGYDTLAQGDKFTLSVGVRRATGGTTDIKALVKATNCKYNDSLLNDMNTHLRFYIRDHYYGILFKRFEFFSR